MNCWLFLLHAITLKIWIMSFHDVVFYIFWNWMKSSKFIIFTKYMRTFRIIIHCLVSFDSELSFSRSIVSYKHVVFRVFRFVVLFSRSVLDKSILKIRFRLQSEYNEIVITSQSQRVKRRFNDSTRWFNAQWSSREEKNIFLNFVRTSDFDNAFFIIFCKLRSILWSDLKSNIMNKILVICVHDID
jgi:hypothetical protein